MKKMLLPVFSSLLFFFSVSAIRDVESVDEFAQVIGDKEKPHVVVDFYLPGCPPCRALAPVLEEVAKKFGDRVAFIKVNVTSLPDLAKKEKVKAMPTIIFFENGKEIWRNVGWNGSVNLVTAIEAAFKL